MNMQIMIRNMHIKDYAAAIRLWQGMAGIGLSGADEREEIKKFLQRNRGLSFVAMADGDLIGTILGGSDGRRGYLYHLAVHPKFRKLGVGKQLQQKSLDTMRTRGIKKCHIFVISDNKPGMAFWRKIGWKFREDITVMSIDI